MAGCCRAAWPDSSAAELFLSWRFACGRLWLPASGPPEAAGLGGTEQAILGLTAALATRGHAVCVTGAATTGRRLQGVDWLAPGADPAADVSVAINDASLLPAAPGLPVIWFHNEVEFLREWRKGRLTALRRHRPAGVFIGRVQAAAASRLLPFRARATIPYGLPAAVLAAEPARDIPPPHALFTSQAYRGLRQVIGLWRTRISPALPGARLTALVAGRDVADYAALAAGAPSVTIQPRVANPAVLDLLRSARLLIVPGHRSETFCLAAAEAIGMGVPVTTRGIGSLSERVSQGRTGIIAPDWQGLAAGIIRLLTEDAIWSAMHAHCLATRVDAGWDHAALAWEDFARDHLAAA